MSDVLPNGPLVVAAGGVSTGKQIAALLTMGASGVVLGTRFLFTDECGYTTAKKDVLLRAGMNSTARGMAFDEVGRTMGWPFKQDGRAVSNNIIQDVEEGLDLEERLKRFDDSANIGDSSRLVVWAGVGVALTNEITAAAVSYDLSSHESITYNSSGRSPKIECGDVRQPPTSFIYTSSLASYDCLINIKEMATSLCMGRSTRVKKIKDSSEDKSSILREVSDICLYLP